MMLPPEALLDPREELSKQSSALHQAMVSPIAEREASGTGNGPPIANMEK